MTLKQQKAEWYLRNREALRKKESQKEFKDFRNARVVFKRELNKLKTILDKPRFDEKFFDSIEDIYFKSRILKRFKEILVNKDRKSELKAKLDFYKKQIKLLN